MDRCNGRRIACYLVAITFSTSLPIVALSEEVRSVRPQLAPEFGPVRSQAAPVGNTDAHNKTAVLSTCTPNYCGIGGQSVYLPWYYPSCGNTFDCGEETWYVKGLPSSATYTIDPITTTGSNRTMITFIIAADAPAGTTTNISLGANCSSNSVVCIPAIVSLTITPPEPVNFHQVGPGVAGPDGVLRFDYKWDSTSGDVADLKNCMVGENVTYPGGNPFIWPNPPYDGSITTNPTIKWGPATLGGFPDTHSHVPFVKPYVANAFNANQDYRYMCNSLPGIVNFPGETGITIARTVSDSTGLRCH